MLSCLTSPKKSIGLLIDGFLLVCEKALAEEGALMSMVVLPNGERIILIFSQMAKQLWINFERFPTSLKKRMLRLGDNKWLRMMSVKMQAYKDQLEELCLTTRAVNDIGRQMVLTSCETQYGRLRQFYLQTVSLQTLANKSWGLKSLRVKKDKLDQYTRDCLALILKKMNELREGWKTENTLEMSFTAIAYLLREAETIAMECRAWGNEFIRDKQNSYQEVMRRIRQRKAQLRLDQLGLDD